MRNNRLVKDSMFTKLLSYKEYALFAYQSLHPDILDVSEDDIEIVTLENVFAIGEYNDFCMTVKDKSIVFIEAQSTWSVNILFRMLDYYVTSMKNYLVSNEYDIYARKPVKLFEPEFYVVYTGKEKVEEVISFNQAYFNGRETILNFKATVITNGNQSKKDFFYQYVTFCKVIPNYQKDYEKEKMMGIEKALEKCVQMDIFTEFIQKHKGEVVDMLDFLYDQERITRISQRTLREEIRAEVKEEVKAEVKEEVKAEVKEEVKAEVKEEVKAEVEKEIELKAKEDANIEFAKRMKENGLGVEVIIACTGLSQEVIEKL